MQSEKRRTQETKTSRRGPRFVPSMITAEDIAGESDLRFKKNGINNNGEKTIFQARQLQRDTDQNRPGVNFTALRDAVWTNHDRFIEHIGTPVLMFISCVLLCVIGYIYQHSLEKKEYAYVEGDLSELTIKAFRMPGTLTRPIRSQQLGFLSEKIQTINRKVDAEKLARVIIDQASSNAFDPLIIASIIKTESAFKRKAMSHKGARGLMQLMPATARYIAQKRDIEWKGLKQLNEPEYNILLGITYFDYLLDMFDNNVEHALMAYNWGPGNVQRVLKQRGHVIPQVRKYARDILLTHKRWKTEQHLSGI